MSLTAMPTSMAGHEDSRAHATIDQERTKAYEQQAADAREYAIMLEAELQRICTGIPALMDENLIPSASTGESKAFYYEKKGDYYRFLAECATGDVKNKAVDVSMVSERQAPQERPAEANKFQNDCDELIPRWLNAVKGVVDSEDLPLNVCRETLLHNKILRVIKKNHVTKYLEILAETAELHDDREKFYERFVKFVKLGIRENSVDDVETLRFNTFKSGDEQFSFEEYVNCRVA